MKPVAKLVTVIGIQRGNDVLANKTNNIKIAISKAPWGREGEIDYCFDMVGLKKDIIDKFIAESRALLSASDRINIGENTNCRGIIK